MQWTGKICANSKCAQHIATILCCASNCSRRSAPTPADCGTRCSIRIHCRGFSEHFVEHHALRWPFDLTRGFLGMPYIREHCSGRHHARRLDKNEAKFRLNGNGSEKG